MAFDWTDDPLSTDFVVKDIHVQELQNNLNIVRQDNGFDPIDFLQSSVVLAEQIEEVRQEIDLLPSQCITEELDFNGTFESTYEETHEGTYHDPFNSGVDDNVETGQRTNFTPGAELLYCTTHYISHFSDHESGVLTTHNVGVDHSDNITHYNDNDGTFRTSHLSNYNLNKYYPYNTAINSVDFGSHYGLRYTYEWTGDNLPYMSDHYNTNYLGDETNWWTNHHVGYDWQVLSGENSGANSSTCTSVNSPHNASQEWQCSAHYNTWDSPDNLSIDYEEDSAINIVY